MDCSLASISILETIFKTSKELGRGMSQGSLSSKDANVAVVQPSTTAQLSARTDFRTALNGKPVWLHGH
ncbi:unnamed protein product [Orchesella dallaii]|uniref:Uncharacterized protein n=1 Tax=Orchesella dallaii TaxID=48710 RepID=A0ABP1Q9W8_9HEXA